MSVANASANNKAPGYSAEADSAAGLDVLGSFVEGAPSLLVVADTTSHSETDKDDGALGRLGELAAARR